MPISYSFSKELTTQMSSEKNPKETWKKKKGRADVYMRWCVSISGSQRVESTNCIVGEQLNRGVTQAEPRESTEQTKPAVQKTTVSPGFCVVTAPEETGHPNYTSLGVKSSSSSCGSGHCKVCSWAVVSFPPRPLKKVVVRCKTLNLPWSGLR